MNPEAILSAVGPMVVALASCYLAKLRRDERRELRAQLARSCDNCKVRLAELEPPPTVGGGVIALVVLAGACWVLSSDVPGKLARLSSASASAVELQAAAAGGSCSRDSDCGSGCSCKSGSCKCAAQKPLVRPGPAPRRLASMDGSLCADCLALPWSPEPIETLWVRRRED